MPHPAGPEQVRAIYSQLHVRSRIQKYCWIYSVSKLIYLKVLCISSKYSINSFTFCAFYCLEKAKGAYSLKFSVLGVQQIPLHCVSLLMRMGANTLLEDDRGCVPDVTWGFLTGIPVTLHQCPWSCLSVHHQLWLLTGRHCADLALPLPARLAHAPRPTQGCGCQHTCSCTTSCYTPWSQSITWASELLERLAATARKKLFQQVPLVVWQWAKASTQHQTTAPLCG